MALDLFRPKVKPSPKSVKVKGEGGKRGYAQKWMERRCDREKKRGGRGGERFL